MSNLKFPVPLRALGDEIRALKKYCAQGQITPDEAAERIDDWLRLSRHAGRKRLDGGLAPVRLDLRFGFRVLILFRHCPFLPMPGIMTGYSGRWIEVFISP